MVAGNNIALLVHAQAAVGVAVVGKAHIQTLLDDELLQAFDVGGAGVFVDVQAVGLGVDDVGGGAQRVKHRLGDVPAGTVGAVQADLHAPEAVHAERDQVADIPVAAGDIVHRAADLVLAGKGQLRPFLAEHLQLAVQVGFDEGDGLLVHLLALAVDQLDAVVITLDIGYDRENCDKGIYHGPVHIDHYGRTVPKGAHGSARLDNPSNLSRQLMAATTELFDRIANRNLTVRRITIAANRVVKDQGILQVDLFTDTSKLVREKSLQATMLGIKKKFGKNAVLKGTNYLEGATMRERNGQIGGHKAK